MATLYIYSHAVTPAAAIYRWETRYDIFDDDIDILKSFLFDIFIFIHIYIEYITPFVRRLPAYIFWDAMSEERLATGLLYGENRRDIYLYFLFSSRLFFSFYREKRDIFYHYILYIRDVT